MNVVELTFEQWRALPPPFVHRAAEEAARRVGGRVVAVDAVRHLGGPWHRVRIERAGREYGLIPGGPVMLGVDVGAWRPTPAQEADYAASAAQRFAPGPDLRTHLAEVLSPRRKVVLPTLLMAVEAEELGGPPEEIPAALAVRGLRLPGADEWEHACGAGADTLFRWGDECPLDRDPYRSTTGPHREPNAFGLRIAYDTYHAELSSDPASVHGGDGGESVCGGYGNLLAWLPLATAHRNPGTAEFVYGEEGEDAWEDFRVRPVLAL
ncbi:hypothetical protein ACIO3O_40535 [Streptomyces sp. NPDC087440]|uniref:hypothetical protein n=1 Tax=Streptomyces sp. NPDC087440 TaxID=3365790 RepID=UPI003826346E